MLVFLWFNMKWTWKMTGTVPQGSLIRTIQWNIAQQSHLTSRPLLLATSLHHLCSFLLEFLNEKVPSSFSFNRQMFFRNVMYIFFYTLVWDLYLGVTLTYLSIIQMFWVYFSYATFLQENQNRTFLSKWFSATAFDLVVILLNLMVHLNLELCLGKVCDVWLHHQVVYGFWLYRKYIIYIPR